MHHLSALISCVWILMVLGALGGCAAPRTAGVSATEWTTAASGAHMDGSGKIFYGIGKAAGVRNPTLLRATADNRAQAEMARVINGYVNMLGRQSGLNDSDDQDRALIAALSESILKKARISDHRYNDPDRAFFSLCSLELTTLKQVLQTDSRLDEPLRKSMLAQADRVYEDFSARQK